MKRWVKYLVMSAVVLWAAPAHAIEGLTGSTWGTVIHNFDDDRLQTLGYVNQGIDWFEKAGFRLNTYAELRWQFQAHQGLYYNSWGPSLGVAVKKSHFRFGAEYYWERRQWSNNSGHALVFVDWYYDWDLLKLFH
jgi:hypothetical protein